MKPEAVGFNYSGSGNAGRLSYFTKTLLTLDP